MWKISVILLSVVVIVVVAVVDAAGTTDITENHC